MFDRCLYFNTNRLSRKISKIWTQAYSELNLAPAHAYLLRLVLEYPGISQKSIADELALDKSTITRFVDKMVDEGYLLRGTNKTEGSNSPGIYPTAKAKKIAKRLNTIGDELYQTIQKAINKEELMQLVSLIRLASSKI